jgi:heparinase II/III-like protein
MSGRPSIRAERQMSNRRLRIMGIGELACRSRQEACKWLERVGLALHVTHDSPCLFPKTPENNGESVRLFTDRFYKPRVAHFFEGVAGNGTAACVAEQFPEMCQQVLVLADAACQGRFDLLGYRGLVFGHPVDWHLDPVSGRRAPFVHWSRINPLDKTAVGDSKVIWELNRHQWLVRLGQAYSQTGDERYAETFAEYLRAWMQANPPGMGINWASSLEVALRLIAWCWALFLFRGSKALSPELFVEILGGIHAHAHHVERYLSYYFSPNTHLTGEALGLVYAGVVFPELRAADRWRKLGAQILIEQSERQILADGVYFEQSTYYQRYTAEIYLHFLILAARNGIEIPATVLERVQRLLDSLLALCWPNGSVPQIGDADGGWILPLAVRAPDDCRGLFSTAAAFFSRSDYAWAAGRLTPETIWLLGHAGVKAYAALCPAPPETSPSRLFAEGGYATMRSGWGPDAHQLIFDVGPLGCPVSGGHGHADLLTIQCSVFGEPYLMDPGTYCYTADPAWRDFFRSTTAHSTVRVDGLNQAVPAGPFAWEIRPRARLLRWLTTPTYDLADAEHHAYRFLRDPVVHRRRVLFVKPRYWVVVDDLEGAAEHRVELRYQFAPLKVIRDGTPWVRVLGAGGHALLIRAFAAVPLEANIVEGALAPIQGWVSPVYGQRRPAPVLVYSAVTKLPLRTLTLLYPIDGLLAHPPKVSLVVGESAEPAGLLFEDSQETVRVDGDTLAVLTSEHHAEPDNPHRRAETAMSIAQKYMDSIVEYGREKL